MWEQFASREQHVGGQLLERQQGIEFQCGGTRGACLEWVPRGVKQIAEPHQDAHPNAVSQAEGQRAAARD